MDIPTLPILIVEDDASIRDMLSDCLSDAGYDVRAAPNGQVALELLRWGEVPPRLILLDLAMPLMNGIQFLHHFRDEQHAWQIPIIILTADQRQQEHAVTMDVAMVLTKPVELDTLLQAIACSLQRNGT